MPLSSTTPDITPTPQHVETVTKGKSQTEDPRKVAAREKFLAEQRLIDAEDALALARANLTDKTKAFEALRGAGKRA